MKTFGLSVSLLLLLAACGQSKSPEKTAEPAAPAAAASKISVDQAPIPARYSAPLPKTLSSLDAWIRDDTPDAVTSRVELDLTSLVTRHAEEDQRELPLRHVVAPPLLESEQLKKSNSGAGIGDSDHRMQEFHFVWLNSSL